MASDSDSRRLLSRLIGRPIIAAMVAAVVTGLLVFVACFMVWYNVGGGAWRGKTHVEAARLISQDTLLLSVVSPGCVGVPNFTMARETDVDVQVAFRVYNTPLKGGNHCIRDIEVPLSEPLGNRALIDMHTGQSVNVTTAYSPVLTSQPPSTEDIMDAEVIGTVVFDDNTGCLYLKQDSEHRYPVVWPAGASWQADPPAVKIHGQLIEPGMYVTGGGGYVSYNTVQLVLGTAVADAAQACADHVDPTALKKDVAFFNFDSEVEVVP